MANEPLPRHFDYQGNERLSGYVRGVTAVRCLRCKTTGVDPILGDPNNVCGNFIGTDIPVCRSCGGYGDVPPQIHESVSTEAESAPIAELIFGGQMIDNL